MTHEVFVSYSQSDRECALELAQHIEAAGLGVWIAPRDVSPGSDWAAQIIQALSGARAMVLVLSAGSNESPQVQREVERAVHKRLHIVPFRIEAVLPSASLEYFLSAQHWLDAFPPPRAPFYARLCAHLQKLLSEAAAPPAAPVPERIGAGEDPRSAPSVAVLPFVNLSSDPEQEYFSDGLSEELIHHLANLRGLHVAGRTSAFSFKGKQEDLRVIGEKLGVEHLLEGSVRKAGNRLRITAQLINCADGYHLWSQTFDRQLTDIFEIQEDIARAVAKALSITLGVGQTQIPGGTRNVEAYDLYLRARAHARRVGSSDLQQAVALYQAALAIDPDFALAWAWLGFSMVLARVYSPEKAGEARQLQEQAFERALQLEPDVWSGHMVRGVSRQDRRDWHEAEQAMQRAVDLAPLSDWDPRYSLAVIFASVGRLQDAVPVLDAVRRAEPLALGLTAALQWILTYLGRDAEADAEYRRGMDLEGDREVPEETALFRAFAHGDPLPSIQQQMRRYLSLSSIHMPVLGELVDVLNQPQQVRALLRQAFEDPGYQDSTRQFKIALWAAQFDDIDLALAAARRAYVDMDGWVLFLLWSPAYRKVRQDPRFKQLLRDLKIVDYWRETGQWGDFARSKGEGDFEVF